jgi:acetyltransferase-like isoleucine patch superfamily enzyme
MFSKVVVSVRKAVRFLAVVAIAPLLVCFWVARLLSGADAAVEGASQFLACLPGRVGVLLRAAFFSRVLSKCDPTVFIGYGALLTKADTRLGKHVYIGPYCQLGWVSIGDDTLLGPSVQIPSGPKAHTFDRLDIPIRNQPGESRHVMIGRDSWIGAGSIVMADVGDQSVVGAGSVVTKPIPAQSLAAGAPCKPCRSRG